MAGEGAIPLEGGCACGAVRYRVTGPAYHRTLCHCTLCRRSTGAPAVAWFSVAEAAFQWLRGVPAQHRATATATRAFCAGCGTALTFRADGLGELDVTTCSLDDPNALPPEDQTFLRSRLAWMGEVARLPGHATARGA